MSKNTTTITAEPGDGSRIDQRLRINQNPIHIKDHRADVRMLIYVKNLLLPVEIQIYIDLKSTRSEGRRLLLKPCGRLHC